MTPLPVGPEWLNLAWWLVTEFLALTAKYRYGIAD